MFLLHCSVEVLSGSCTNGDLISPKQQVKLLVVMHRSIISQQWKNLGNLSGMSLDLAHMCTRMSLHAPCSRRERRSWKAVHLSPYIRGGAQAEQCVLSFREEIAETFFSLSAKKAVCVCVCMHVCLKLLSWSEEDGLYRAKWYVSAWFPSSFCVCRQLLAFLHCVSVTCTASTYLLWVGVVKSVFTFINTGAVIVGLSVCFKTSHKNLHCKTFPGFWRVTKEVVVVHARTQS